MNRAGVAMIILFFAGYSSTLIAQNLVFVKATDDNIRVIGRTMTNSNGDIEFEWPGITIIANFSGSTVSVKMDDTKRNFYNVFIDDRDAKIVEVHSDTLLQLVTGLSDGSHLLKIVKRTEGEQGHATFKGLVLSESGKLLPPPPRSDRKIEFIGNSITCGYGTDSFNKIDPFKPETEDCYKAYGAITARAFGAEYHLVSHSGMGVVRNYGYKEQLSPYAMPDLYKQVFDVNREQLWDFSQWKPDIVVINLGTNDFSTQPYPDEMLFNKGYQSLISFVRSNYGNIPIFCIVGPMADEPGYSYVKKMVEANRKFKQDKNVYFIGIPTYLMIEDEDLGASYHPNYSGQIKMAEQVIPVISSVMDWDYGAVK